MAKWTNRASEHYQKAGLLEPRTKAAKIRAALPIIEAALENGATYEQCNEQFKSLGVEMSLPYFRNALHRARKKPASTELGQIISVREAIVPGQRKGKSEPKEARKVTASGATIVLKQQGGMFISSVEEKDQLTNAMPRMEDFI